MRTCLVISAICHAAIVLLLILAQGTKPFDPAYADAVVVDLIQPPDDPPAPQERSEPSNPERIKASAADRRPAPGSEEDKAAAAARLARLLEMPAAAATNLAATPSENKANLPADLLAKLKAQVRKCFVPPTNPPDVSDFLVQMRIALNRDGTLAADPEMIFAPGSPNGPSLLASARRALQQCQPYRFMPADKYAEWRVLDLIFSIDGPADDGNAVIQKIQSLMAAH
jgi:hypothetical protein